jgi:hypothetical protein
MRKRETSLLMAAVAGIALGAGAPASVLAGEKTGDVKCWGVNGCGSHAKCAVAAEDLRAFRTLLGDKEYRARFGKSEVHACGSHAKCGASARILNWVPTGADECKAQGGYVVEETGSPKKKVARKA